MRRLVSLATYFKSDKETRSAGDKKQNHETADANPLLLVSVSPPLLVSSSGYPAKSAKNRVSSMGGTVLFSSEEAINGLPSGRTRISWPPCF